MRCLRRPALLCLSGLLIVVSQAQTLRRQPAFTGPSITDARFCDGTFDAGMQSWEFRQNTESSGSFALTKDQADTANTCAKITIHTISPEIWHVQLIQKNFPVQKNFMYRLSYRARGTNPNGVLEAAFVKGSPPWTFYSAKKATITPGWKQYEMLFTAPLTTTDIQLAFQCARHTGDYYLDDITFEQAGTLDLKEIPPEWYQAADIRIDSIRKGDFSLAISDKNGAPWQGTVEIKLIRHQFQWGTCLAFLGGEEETRYRKTALKHFNAGVFENAFKWEEYEQAQGQPAVDVLKEYLAWSRKHDFPIRGHALVWGIELFGFDKHWARVKDDAFLVNAMKNRITRDVTLYKNQLLEYDVWNEPVHEPALFFRLGRNIIDSAFIWAHRADPAARLFINEYSIIAGSDTKIYRDLITELQKRSIPVHGIGIQGHFSSRIDPCDVAAKLYYMGETGLPLKITEFDMDVRGLGLSDKEMAAEYAKIMRTAFSHPSVEGFYFWGFWDARHWRPGAGLYDYDFNPKPAADSVYNLIHKTWTTRKTLKTDPSGAINFRGFFGKYEINAINDKGKKRKYTVEFLRNSTGKMQFVFKD